MKKDKRIVISGYYGFNNSGDDAILKAIVKDVKDACSDIEITALSKNPQSTMQTYGIKAVNRFNLLKVIREIYRSDLLISGGGSLLQDVTSTRSIVYYLAIMYMANILKKPVMIYANGIGPVNKKFNRLFTKKVLNKVNLITLRDLNSKKTLEDINVNNNNIYVTSDPVFTLKPAEEHVISKILFDEGVPQDRPLVAISIREWTASRNLKETIVKTIEYIDQMYNANVLLVPMHYPEDLSISKEVKDSVCTKNCYLLTKNYSVEEIMGLINKMEIIVAMRLQSLIYAATQGVPMIGLVYDPKVDGFLDSIGLDYKCNVEDLDVEDLHKVIDRAWVEKDNTRRHLKVIRDSLKQKALDNIKMVLSILQSR